MRSGAELLDRLLKACYIDINSRPEACVLQEIVRSTERPQLEELILLIRERIYASNSSNRRFIISWASKTALKRADA